MFIAAYLLLFHFASGQDLQLDPHMGKLASYIKFEQGLGSVTFPRTSSYISGQGIAQPEIYRRKEKSLPDRLAYYFYYSEDSTLESILYEWHEANFPGYNDTVKKSSVEVLPYIKKYNALYAQIAAKYGKSKQEGDLSDTAQLEKGLRRTDTWEPNDSTEIEMYCTLWSIYQKNEGSSVNPFYVIRLYVRNVKKSDEAPPISKLNDGKIHSLDSAARGFFSAMKDKNFDLVKTYVPANLAQNITNDQLEQLSQLFRFADSVELIFNGIQMGTDGTQYYFLQYKYVSDTNTPPKEMINLLFDDRYKITGVRPLKRT